MGPSESGNVKATVAVLSFVLSSVAKHSVDGGCLSSEVQQLGLPKEHVASLCHSYEEKQSPLQKHLGPSTYAVSMSPASVRAHSRRCTQHAKCMESPGRRLNHGHMPSSCRAGTWPWVS
uniref:COMM domain-containing protein 4-like n=1 Tax=Macaca mulatta TaxID=9544 RepID=UPI0010A2712C|nr:COMM domain-containing protein 4-like [Macaca mulatta]